MKKNRKLVAMFMAVLMITPIFPTSVFAMDKQVEVEASSLTSSEIIPNGKYYIVGEGVAIRSNHSTSSTVKGRLYQSSGHTIKVTKSYDTGIETWAYGKASTGISGWVRADFLGWY